MRGRSSGVRLLLAYQSDSQVKAAFKDKPTLIHDNCSTQIYLGASSIETAERLSKSLGEWTQVVESGGDSDSKSHQVGPLDSHGTGGQTTWGRSRNWQSQACALMRPEELLVMSGEYLIALIGGMPPIKARRVKWYSDPLFGTTSASHGLRSLWWWVCAGSALALIAWGLLAGS